MLEHPFKHSAAAQQKHPVAEQTTGCGLKLMPYFAGVAACGATAARGP